MDGEHLRSIVPLSGKISLNLEGGNRVLRLRGDVDATAVQDFRQRYGEAPLPIDVVDAGAVTFLSCAGIALLIRCWQASLASGRIPALRPSCRLVDHILQVLGVDELLVSVP